VPAAQAGASSGVVFSLSTKKEGRVFSMMVGRPGLGGPGCWGLGAGGWLAVGWLLARQPRQPRLPSPAQRCAAWQLASSAVGLQVLLPALLQAAWQPPRVRPTRPTLTLTLARPTPTRRRASPWAPLSPTAWPTTTWRCRPRGASWQWPPSRLT
jgi:hypothetical protein